MNEIGVNDLYRFIKEDKKKFYLIDIRADKDFLSAHAEGAENLSSKIKLISKFSELKAKDAHIFFMCYLGNSSLVTQALFKNNGYNNVFSVAGGFGAWRDANLPIAYSDSFTKKKVELDLVDLTTDDDYKEVSAKDQLELLGLMSASVFHELANPLTIVDAGVRVCNTKLSRLHEVQKLEDFKLAGESIEKQFLTISRSVKRMKDILQFMRGFSYNVELEQLEGTNLRVFFDDLGMILSLGDKIDIKYELCKSVENKKFKLNKNQLIQIIINLVTNAKDAIAELSEQHITISVETNNDKLQFSVTDSGSGITDDMLKKIVQPLFTTKEKGKGTGLGVPVVKKLCVANGGKLYYNKACSNTSFVFTVKLIEDLAA